MGVNPSVLIYVTGILALNTVVDHLNIIQNFADIKHVSYTEEFPCLNVQPLSNLVHLVLQSSVLAGF